MRKILIISLILMFGLSGLSVFAQNKRARVVRHPVAARSYLSPVTMICYNDPLPAGYWIVRETFSSSCPLVNNFPRAYMISIDGTEPGGPPVMAAAAAAAPESTQSSPTADSAREAINRRAAIETARGAAALAADEAIKNRKAAVENAIRQGNVMIGMTYSEVKSAWGNPYDTDTIFVSGCAKQKWWYKKSRRGSDIVLLTFNCDGLLDYIGY
jgi:hypothetical protein